MIFAKYKLANGKWIAVPGTPIVTVTDDALIKAIVATVGDRTFNSRELYTHAGVDGALRAVIGDMSAQRIGKALQTIASRNFDGYMIERMTRDNEGAVYRVVVVR